MLNLGKILNKKVIFIFGVVLILCAAGGLFFWWQNREIKGSPADYIIKETEEGKFVENKKAGFNAKIPENWETKNMEIEGGAEIFYPSNTEIEWKNEMMVLPPQKGCVIQTTVVYKKMDFDQIKQEAKYTHLMMGKIYEEFEELTIDNKPALKNTFETQKSGSGMGIYIPAGDKVLAFYLHWASEEKEICNRKFDQFLETVSINPD